MAEITAQLVKELREKTGVGMMDCKKALAENNGDIEASIDWLRAKGLSKAAKKADRVAADGLVGLQSTGLSGAICEVNSETDFVARNDIFQGAVRSITAIALSRGGDFEATAGAPSPDGDGTVKDMLLRLVATVGENMNLRRTAGLSVSDGVVATYMHNVVSAGLGRIGVLVALESTGDKAALKEAGSKIAMHVASADPAPLATVREELDPKVIEKERSILLEQVKESGKPANVAEKMVEGRLRKFYEEVVLNEQAMFGDKDMTVAKFVETLAKEIGAPVVLKGFVKYKIGEGIEKEVTDFAAEVAAFSKS
jgi:elongation factor Ts